MAIKDIAANLASRGLKDVLDPKVWKSYGEYKDIKDNGLFLEEGDIVAYAEQLVYRMYMCKECVAAGKCRDCKCPVPEKMMAPAARCSEKRWAENMEAEDWKQYKKDNGIEFVVVTNR